jgi:hypothetical protein
MPRTLLSQLGPRGHKTDRRGTGMVIGGCQPRPPGSRPSLPGGRGSRRAAQASHRSPAGLRDRLISELELLGGPETLAAWGAAGNAPEKPAVRGGCPGGRSGL